MKNNLAQVILFLGVLFFISCGDDDASSTENEEQVITNVSLTFRSATEVITAEVSDASGLQPWGLISDSILLAPGSPYTLNIILENRQDPNNIEDITEEIREKGEEYMFFFGWTGQIFQSPTGLGNIGAGNRDELVNYDDQDTNGLPLGLETIWETTDQSGRGSLRIILKHQPEIKSATSTSEDGESDIDLNFPVKVE